MMTRPDLQSPIDISVIIPLLNEAESLEELCRRLTEIIVPMECHFELIFVDDGSQDNSFEVLKKLHAANGHVKIIQFRRNYGKAAALYAGFQHARGDIIITIDADLQDIPEELPLLIEKVQEGYDLVSGWKTNRRDPISKKVASKIFNATVSFSDRHQNPRFQLRI